MLHFVIKDANPKILQQSTELVEILNDTVLLISAANGPILNAAILKKQADKIVFEKSESIYVASFSGAEEAGKLNSGKFILLEDGALIMELAFTVNSDAPCDVRVKLNCEGEKLVRQELESAFERDFSFDAEKYMSGGFKADMTPDKVELINDEPIAEASIPESEPESENVEDSSDESNFSLELDELPADLLRDLSNAKKMLGRFNNITHDISRGSVGDFSMMEIGEEIIENGAKIQFVDYQKEDYIVTFRLGELKGEIEVSFFLEEGDALIFSVHCSSQGTGSIIAEDDFISEKVERLLMN